jgi:hypothetical protein
MAVGRIETAIVLSIGAVVFGAVGWAILANHPPPRKAQDEAASQHFVAAPAIGLAAIPTVALAPSPPTPQAFIATVANEAEWRSDRLPETWPRFTKLPDEKPLPAKTARQKLEAAKSVNERWDAFQAGRSKTYPTSDESGTAIKQLLTVDAKGLEFPAAWAVFVRLRQVDREISQETALERGRLMLRNAPKNNGVRIGMTAEEVRKSSWGKPTSINETITAGGKHEQWVYGGGHLYIENGVLTSIQTSRRSRRE